MMAVGLLCIALCLFGLVVGRHNLNPGGSGVVGGRGGGKIAVLWVSTGEPVFYWKWTLVTLLNGGADRVDVHMFLGVDAEKLQGYRQQLRDYALSDRVFFHSVRPEDWRDRISQRMGINITYPIETLGRKIADFKPCLGDLFEDFLPPREYSYWVYGDSDGFFGSYDRMLDRNALASYDVVSGMPPPPLGSEAWSSISGQWVPTFCTGGWTLMRNIPRINKLYRRSSQWRELLSSPKYRSFDEDSSHTETMQTVLKSLADDVRRCCINDRTPQVLRKSEGGQAHGAPFHMYIAGVDATYVDKNNTLQLLWRAGQGLSVTLEGNVGKGGAYRRETSRVLFLHFLQLKYCCGRQLFDSMKAFLTSLDQPTSATSENSAAAVRSSVLDLRCFTLHAARKTFVFAKC